MSTATPAERRKENIRRRILQAADEMLALEGALGLSIRRLAEITDYSPAAIYRYFPSKESLVEELKEAFFARLVDNLSASLDQSIPFKTMCRGGLRTYIETALEKPNHYLAVFSAPVPPVDAQSDHASMPETSKQRAFEFLQDLVKEGKATGGFDRDLNVDLSTRSLWVGLHGLAMMIAHMPGFPNFRDGDAFIKTSDFIDFYIDRLVTGLEAKS